MLAKDVGERHCELLTTKNHGQEMLALLISLIGFLFPKKKLNSEPCYMKMKQSSLPSIIEKDFLFLQA